METKTLDPRVLKQLDEVRTELRRQIMYQKLLYENLTLFSDVRISERERPDCEKDISLVITSLNGLHRLLMLVNNIRLACSYRK